MSGKGKPRGGNGGTATLTRKRLVIAMSNGVRYDPQGHGHSQPKNVGIFSAGDKVRVNNHGGTVIVAGRELDQYESVDLSVGETVQINGQNGKVVRV